MQIFSLIVSATPEKLEAAVRAASDKVFLILRKLVLQDPADMAEADPAKFLEVSSLRSEWLVRGWRAFFIEHENPPRPEPESVKHNPASREPLTISAYPRDFERLREYRHGLENRGIKRVTNSGILRGFLWGYSPDFDTLEKFYISVEQDDLRRRKRD